QRPPRPGPEPHLPPQGLRDRRAVVSRLRSRDARASVGAANAAQSPVPSPQSPQVSGRHRHRPRRRRAPSARGRALRAYRAESAGAARTAAPARVRPRARRRPDAADGAAVAATRRPARRPHRARPMIPLGIFLLGLVGVYLGTIETAFGALMRLSLRLVAERANRPGTLVGYLGDPLLLFIPVRLLLGFVTGAATALLARAIGVDGAHTVLAIVLAILAFVVAVEILLPLLIVGRDPERVLEVLLPTFAPFARALGP